MVDPALVDPVGKVEGEWPPRPGAPAAGTSPSWELQKLRDQLRVAAVNGFPLRIEGGGSKNFYGRPASGEALRVGAYRGVLSYHPEELVVVVRAGTRLVELERVLADSGQILAFEPPHFGPGATVGGTVACGLSGPRRPYAGACRDFVLGVRCLNGRGEDLRFGGQVIKNVAGYDLARLLTGSLGTLAVLLEISLRVAPAPELEISLRRVAQPREALKLLHSWEASLVPLSAATVEGGYLNVRLSGKARVLRPLAARLGLERHPEGLRYWRELREQRLPFFSGEQALWRLVVPPGTPFLDLPGRCLLDWAGTQYWIKSGAPARVLRAVAKKAGGHALLFRGEDARGEVFQSLAPRLAALHNRLKDAFDGQRILNRGVLFPGL